MVARKTIDGHPAHFDWDRYEWIFDDTGKSAEGINRCKQCAEENYIIPIEFLEKYNPLEKYDTALGWMKNFGGIPVDYCIHREIMYLIENGVITVCCCCSHGAGVPDCLIKPESVDRAKELGYNPIPYTHTNSGYYEIMLKGDKFEY